MILGQDIIARTLGDLSRYLYTNQLYMAKAVLLQNGRLEIETVIAVVLYVFVPTLISANIFNKKELEF